MSDIWLGIQLGFSVICCCLPTYGLLSPKANILTPAKIMWSKLVDKIITTVTSRARSEQGFGLQKISGLNSKSYHKDSSKDGEVDRVGLTHVGEDFELEERRVVAQSDPSLNAVSINSTVEIV